MSNPPSKDASLTPEEIQRVIKYLQSKDPQKPRVKDELQLGRETLDMDKNIQSEYVQRFQNEELIGVLSAFPKFGVAVKEKIVVMADAQNGIRGILRSMGKTRWNSVWILITIIAVALIALVGLKPELLNNAGVFFQDRYNQMFALAGGVITLIIIYLLMRRGRRNYY